MGLLVQWGGRRQYQWAWEAHTPSACTPGLMKKVSKLVFTQASPGPTRCLVLSYPLLMQTRMPALGSPGGNPAALGWSQDNCGQGNLTVKPFLFPC